MIFTPLETAAAIQDEVVHFLADMEAGVSKEIRNALSRRGVKLTLLDAVRESLKTISKSIEKLETKESDDETGTVSAATGWKGYYASLKRAVDASEKKSNAKRMKQYNNGQAKEVTVLRNLREVRDYLVRIESLLVSLQAKSWPDLHPEDKAPDAAANNFFFGDDSDQDEGYWFITSHYSRSAVPKHMQTQYDDLFEAAFNGDNETIQKLCLPAADESQPNPKPPIQISVRLIRGRYAFDGMINQFNNFPQSDQIIRSGYTPLFAAISQRRWSTAKLIMAIAAAQYDPQNEENKFVANVDFGRFQCS